MDLKALLTPRRKSVSAKQIQKLLDKDTKRLDLTEKKLGDEAFRTTALGIYNLEIQQLDLFGNGLTDAAISDICELLTIVLFILVQISNPIVMCLNRIDISKF